VDEDDARMSNTCIT